MNRRSKERGRRCIKVNLPASIQHCYDVAKTIARSEVARTWCKREPNTLDIGELVRNSMGMGIFSKTGFEYAVFLLGSRLFSYENRSAEGLIRELYAAGYSKVQHGVFATVPLSIEPEKNFDNREIVAQELAEIFREDPNMWRVVREQWLPHGDMILGSDLTKDCKLLIDEYIKHGPNIGLCLADYIKFTSTLYQYCDPDFSDWADVFSEEMLKSNLLSLSKQPIPCKAITRCNKKHDICLLAELRYLFKWEGDELVSYPPQIIQVRFDNCPNSNAVHDINYLTQQKRTLLQTKIFRDPLNGFGNIEDGLGGSGGNDGFSSDDEVHNWAVGKKQNVVAAPPVRGSSSFGSDFCDFSGPGGWSDRRTRGGGGELGNGEEQQRRRRLMLDAQSERGGEGGVALQQGVMKAEVNLFGDSKPREVLLEEKGLDWKKIDLGWERIDRCSFPVSFGSTRGGQYGMRGGGGSQRSYDGGFGGGSKYDGLRGSGGFSTEDEVDIRAAEKKQNVVGDEPSSGQSGSAESERGGEGGVALQQGVTKAKGNLFGNSKPREVLLEEKGVDWKTMDLSWERTDRKKY